MFAVPERPAALDAIGGRADVSAAENAEANVARFAPDACPSEQPIANANIAAMPKCAAGRKEKVLRRHGRERLVWRPPLRP